ncbi:MAG: hypothetical protein VB042_08800 [Victivallaceae bacterium]|nr:hypothetical protein [Victivallaceae bacterium]
MLRDRLLEAARDPACAYAIDAKASGGRLISPLQAPAWVNFADHNKTWTGTAAIFNGIAGDFTFEINLTEKAFVANGLFFRGSGKFAIVEYPSNDATYGWVILLTSLFASHTWTVVNSAYIAYTSQGQLCLKRSVCQLDTEVIIKLKRVGSVISAYVNNVLIATDTGTIAATTNTDDFISTASCNIKKAELQSATTVVWQAITNEIYSTWRPVPGTPWNPSLFGQLSLFGMAEALISASAGDFGIRLKVARSSTPTVAAWVIYQSTYTLGVQAPLSGTTAYIVYITGFAATGGVWTVLDDTRINATSAGTYTYFAIPLSYAPIASEPEINLHRVGDVVNVYVDSVLSATYAAPAALLSSTATFYMSPSFNGSVPLLEITDADGTVIWDKLAGWEVDSGLITASNVRVVDGEFVKYIDSQSGQMLTPIDLRGCASSFTFQWLGYLDIVGTTTRILAIQGTSTSNATIYLYLSATGVLVCTITDGTTVVSTSGYMTSYTDGWYLISAVVDFNAMQVKVYVGPDLLATTTLTISTLYANAPKTSIDVRALDGLKFFGFWDKALSAEEVRALS